MASFFSCGGVGAPASEKEQVRAYVSSVKIAMRCAISGTRSLRLRPALGEPQSATQWPFATRPGRRAEAEWELKHLRRSRCARTSVA